MSVVDPTTDLVRQAMGYGVMMALEGRQQLLAMLRSAGDNVSLAELLTEDAEGFCHTPADLVEALRP